MRTLSALLARFFFLSLCLLAGIYCLLAYIPWTYQAVLKFNMVAWLPAFLRWHPWLLLGALLANATVDGLFRGGYQDTLMRRAFYGLQAGAALIMGIHPLLPRLENTPASYGYALAFIASILALGILDLVADRKRMAWFQGEGAEGRRLLVASAATAAYLVLVYLATAFIKVRLIPGLVSIHPIEPFLWSLPGHLLIFLMAAVGVLAIEALGRLFHRPGAAFVIWLLAGTGLLATLFEGVAFPALSFSGAPALLLALLLGLALMAFLGALALRFQPEDTPATSALDLLLSPLHRILDGSWWLRAAWFVGLAGLAALVAIQAAVFDWNFLFQKLGAALLWALAFGSFYAWAPRGAAHRGWDNALFLTTLAMVGLFRVADVAVRSSGAGTIDSYFGYDASARLVRDALRPVEQAGASIYKVLQRNSNISQDIRTDPVEVNLVPHLGPTPGPHPNIFVLVVDSLRQDYVGAYNPKVTFTPNIDQFAAENTVFRNAFTRYGATGLSEPSIWVGGMILHKQYVRPFYPMNTLQKLVETDGYQADIAMDNVLDVVVKRTPGLVELVKGTGTEDLRMCGIVQDLEAKLDHQGQDPRPVFAYAQCQDIHISVINREGKDVPGGGDYPGFYAPYASRLRRVDQCFGDFIRYLKAKGLYDNSIVVLCADHGDSLGEQGRFGHAYTLFPEILRVPLIVHLPVSLRGRMVADPARPAFLTDITPSLYYLLGHRPLAVDPILGRPLFTERLQEQDAYRQDHYLLASSYGAVFAILGGDGQSLYIADGVNFTDSYFDLSWDPKGTRNAVTPGLKAKYDAMILKDLAHLNAFYHFRNGTP
jgi:hypothetical protein